MHSSGGGTKNIEEGPEAPPAVDALVEELVTSARASVERGEGAAGIGNGSGAGRVDGKNTSAPPFHTCKEESDTTAEATAAAPRGGEESDTAATAAAAIFQG